VKKLISIGVALALLTMAILPGAVAAYEEPATYAKVPFAIIQSGLELIGDIIGALPAELGIPAWIADVTDTIAPWAGGPLSWTVDMLGWGIWLVGDIVGSLDSLIAGMGMELPFELSEIAGIFNTIACGLFTPWTTVAAPDFDPCGVGP
jgi:hypothetical protein